MKAWKTFMSVVVIFLAGLLTGGALVWKLANQSEVQTTDATSGVSFQPWQLKDRYVGYLAKKLELSQEQKSAISQIVTESQHRTKVLFETVGPEMQQEMNRVRDAIRAILSPVQQIEFDEIQRRHLHYRKESGFKSNDEKRKPSKFDSGHDDVKGNHPALDDKCENQWLMDNLLWTPIRESRCSG